LLTLRANKTKTRLYFFWPKIPHSVSNTGQPLLRKGVDVSVISVQNLRKTYGRLEALRGVSLDVEPKQIYGLLGQNGAGKSTMIKILLGIVNKTDGEATLLGEDAGNANVRKRVGYLPEDHQFPAYHTGRSLMHFYGELYGLSRPERTKRMNEAFDIVGLAKRADNKVKTYSKGMKQRLGIAQSFFHDPEVIFLDEPTDGVDPVGRKEIRELLVTLKNEGRTIFVNSHLLAEVQLMADRVAVIHKGELMREGSVEELTRQTDRFELGLASGQTFPVKELGELGYTVTMADGLAQVMLNDGQGIDPVLEFLWQRGLKLRHLMEKKQSLEGLFVDIVEKENKDIPKVARRARKADAREENE
jgi:ABC-2 type transport system ATP-binding protein